MCYFLDRQYIPTRYPDVYPEGSPYEFYTEKNTDGCINCTILNKRWDAKMKLIILFGSGARRDFTQYSDYEVLVVGDKIPKGPRKLPDSIYLRVIKMFSGEVDAVFMNTEVF